jgi:ribose transport system substrate-binding protein
MLNHGQALRSTAIQFRLVAGLFAVLGLCCGCQNRTTPTIAFIPRTSGTPLWEPAHLGAEIAAQATNAKIYWNAPTREDDVQAQIALVDSVIDRKYDGLVLAPDQALALIAPVRRALSKGIPTVIIASPLPLPAGAGLTYILSDEDEAGRMAALRVGELLRGTGTIAILGINPDITGIMTRARSLETSLAQRYPGIKIVEKRMGSFNTPHDQQVAEETLRTNPDLNAIVALTSSATRGTCSALSRGEGKHSVKVVGFDEPDPALLVRDGNLDSMILPRTREMGIQAVQTIVAQLRGQPAASEAKLKPVLVTPENFESAGIREMFSMDWRRRQ